MTREEKGKIVESLVEKFNNSNFFYVADASGLTVADINGFRKSCYEKGVEFKVYKNTLISKALEQVEGDFNEFSGQVLKGYSGLLFADEVAKAPAETIKKFRKEKDAEKPALKGAFIDGAFYYGDSSLDELSKLKSKAELIGEIIGLLQSPATNVVSALQSGKHTLAGVLKTLSEKSE